MKQQVDKVKQYYTRNKYYFEILIVILSSSLAVASLVISVITYIKSKNNVDQYEQIVDNLRQPYITSFRLETGTCEENEFSLFYVPWIGTLDGCDCSKSSSLDVENIMYSGYCGVDRPGCTVIYQFSNNYFDYLAYNDKSKPVTICGKRANNFHQFHRIANSKTGTCSSTQKTCGNPNKSETIICVESADPCPIYSFLFSSTAQAQYTSPDWGSLQINSNLYFYYDQKGSSSTQLPISQLVTTSGPGPCQFYVYKQTKYGDEYLLMKWTRETCDTDTEFIKSNLSIKEEELYKMNLSKDKYEIVSNFVGFDLKNSQEVYTTYYKPFIPWNISNRNQLFDLVNDLLNINDMVQIMFYSLVTNAASVFVVGIYLGVHYIMFITFYRTREIDNHLIGFKRYKLLVSFVFKVVAMGIAVYAFVVSRGYKDSLEQVVQTKPTLEVYLKQFEVLYNFTQIQIYQNNMIAIITTGANMVIDIVTLILDFQDEKKRKKNLQQVQPQREIVTLYNNNNNNNNNNEKLEIEDLETKDLNQQNKIQNYSPQINSNQHENNQNLLSPQEEGFKTNTVIQSSPILNNQSKFPLLIEQAGKGNISQSTQSKIIVLNEKGLVFENGMLKTRKDLVQFNL